MDESYSFINMTHALLLISIAIPAQHAKAESQNLQYNHEHTQKKSTPQKVNSIRINNQP